MVTKYFQHDCEDAERIAVVSADDADDIYGAGFEAADELSKADLLDGFASWVRYEGFAKGSAIVEVMSEDGD